MGRHAILAPADNPAGPEASSCPMPELAGNSSSSPSAVNSPSHPPPGPTTYGLENELHPQSAPQVNDWRCRSEEPVLFTAVRRAGFFTVGL
ncbi:MAG: hypothetical protein ACRBN8_40565 [Nannocystales bacterium]